MRNYFTAETLEELKKQYRKLAKQYHPDLNKEDTNKIMAEISNQYEQLFARLKKLDKKAYQHKESATDTGYRSVIDVLVKYSELNIDIVGSWIWVSGNTYSLKGILKELGFKWSSSNKKWYYGEVDGQRKKAISWEKKIEKYGVHSVQRSAKKEKVLIASAG